MKKLEDHTPKDFTKLLKATWIAWKQKNRQGPTGKFNSAGMYVLSLIKKTSLGTAWNYRYKTNHERQKHVTWNLKFKFIDV